MAKQTIKYGIAVRFEGKVHAVYELATAEEQEAHFRAACKWYKIDIDEAEFATRNTGDMWAYYSEDGEDSVACVTFSEVAVAGVY